MKTKNTAILVIDMQSQFLESIPPETRNRQVKSIANLLRVGVDKKIPVFFIEYLGVGQTLPELTELVPKDQRVILTKRCDDAFQENVCLANLYPSKHTAKTLIVSGIYASACVYDTVESALKRRFRVLSSADLISDPPEYWENTVQHYSSRLKTDSKKSTQTLISHLC